MESEQWLELMEEVTDDMQAAPQLTRKGAVASFPLAPAPKGKMGKVRERLSQQLPSIHRSGPTFLSWCVSNPSVWTNPTRPHQTPPNPTTTNQYQPIPLYHQAARVFRSNYCEVFERLAEACREAGAGGGHDTDTLEAVVLLLVALTQAMSADVRLAATLAGMEVRVKRGRCGILR